MKQTVFEWLRVRLPLDIAWRRYFSHYYLAKNLNIWYVWGALALLVLVSQGITGFWLTMFYTPTIQHAFQSIQTLMRDVPYGWLFRYMHTTGASAIFFILYLHIFRGLLYGSYQRPRELVWIIGVMLWITMLLESVLGYLLPWGQLSYWGAQVITAMLGVVPYVGDALVTWIRGDFSIGQPTLQRFFAFHVIGIPVFLSLLTLLHLVALRHVGSSNPDGIKVPKRASPATRAFYPFFVLKDCLAMTIFLTIFCVMVFFYPHLGGYLIDPANAVPADPFVTPNPLTPMWYMAPFYGMLRAIPNKSAGICTMFTAMGLLFLLPCLDKSPVSSMRYKGLYSRLALSLLIISVGVLGYVGINEPTAINQLCAQVATGCYFFYFIGMPWYTRFESTRPLPEFLA